MNIPDTTPFFDPEMNDASCGKYILTEGDINTLNCMSGMIEESIYVVDLYRKQFVYVAPNPLFLCKYAPEEVKELSLRYYSIVTHPDDMILLRKIKKTILHFLDKPDNLAGLECISFNFRIRSDKSYPMINHSVAPFRLTDDGKVCMVLCKVAYSVQKEAGNLCAHYTDRASVYYSFERHRWLQRVIALTPPEKEIIRLAKLGKSTKEIAEHLYLSPNTIRNQKNNIYKKLCVNTIEKAIIIATNQRLF